MSFDERAKSWDNDKRMERAKRVSEEIAKAVKIEKSYSAMEFGCGTGLISFNLYDKFKHVTLIDSSKGMIEVLNKKIDDCKASNMSARQLVIEDENSIEERYDVIYNSMVLHHIKDTKKIINAFHGLLNPEGYIIIVDLDKEDGSFHKNEPGFDGHNGFDQEEMKKLLSDAGFVNVEVRTFYNSEKIIEGEKIEYSLFIVKGRKK